MAKPSIPNKDIADTAITINKPINLSALAEENKSRPTLCPVKDHVKVLCQNDGHLVGH